MSCAALALNVDYDSPTLCNREGSVRIADFKRQTELEIEMAGLGAARFRSRATKDMQQERGSGTQPGSYLFGRAIDPLAEAIGTFITDVYGGRPGPRGRSPDQGHGS